ncbi:MAG: sugar nucleotide-binding protein [Alphaproteobacteria bacterium]|nr:sugar nucleotide-binding protein [Alphaproteobacteria bacterium]
MSSEPRQPPRTPPAVLIIGASGFVGRALVRRLADRRAVATGHRRHGNGLIPFDARRDSVEALIDRHGPFGHALLLHGMTRPDQCFADPEAARRLNVESMRRLVSALVERGTTPVFTSSEVVFDGRRGAYAEGDEPRPLMLYGQHKVEVERFLVALDPAALVVRLGRVVGASPGDGTLFSDWLPALARGTDIPCATDHVFSPIHASDAAEAMARLIDDGRTGIVHVAGPEAMSRLDMLKTLMACWRRAGLPLRSRILGRPLASFPTPEPRPRDVSLSIERLVRWSGFTPRDVSAICEASIGAWRSTRKGAAEPSPRHDRPVRDQAEHGAPAIG